MAKIDGKVERWLKAWGWPERRIQNFAPETELLRDMEILGDTADEGLTVLHDAFGVDFSRFSFDEHFPAELSGDALWMTVCKWLRLHKHRKRVVGRYLPITLDDVRKVMERGAWPPDAVEGGERHAAGVR